MNPTPPTAQMRALESLDGLSIGDAFGERFFGRVETVLPRIARREVPQTEWPYTDGSQRFGFVNAQPVLEEANHSSGILGNRE